MKISISYPPLDNKKGVPTLTQNRQFQYFNSPTYIYPVVPASAATLLHKNGYEVFWDDGIAEELSYKQWLKRIIKEKPDIIVIETKTPVIKQHWQIIKELKNKSLEIVRQRRMRLGRRNWDLKIILMGDHATALPEESFEHCPVDYVLTGGDYDFMLLNLANHLTKHEELEAGWYLRQAPISNFQFPNKSQIPNFKIQRPLITSTEKFQLNHDLNSLLLIDRELTKWKLYAYKNGNFKYTPGTYIMASRDCWYGKCSFCSWANTLFPCASYRVRKVENVLEEIGSLIKLGVKEIMDDSGTFPIDKWLEEFCRGMIERGYNKKVKISCNMRINAIQDLKIYELMKQAGFRMILFGLESANQKTLDKLNKGLQVKEIEPCLKICHQAGLEPHITVMVGYPWEALADVERTLCFVKKLFHDGIVDSLQATIMIPYPGTELYKYCLENDLLKKDLFESGGVSRLASLARDDFAAMSGKIDYDRFDQRESVMKSSLSNAEIKKMIRKFYRSFLTPKFFWNKIKSIRSCAYIKFYLKAGLKILGHLGDFKKNKKYRITFLN